MASGCVSCALFNKQLPKPTSPHLSLDEYRSLCWWEEPGQLSFLEGRHHGTDGLWCCTGLLQHRWVGSALQDLCDSWQRALSWLTQPFAGSGFAKTGEIKPGRCSFGFASRAHSVLHKHLGSAETLPFECGLSAFNTKPKTTGCYTGGKHASVTSFRQIARTDCAPKHLILWLKVLRGIVTKNVKAEKIKRGSSFRPQTADSILKVLGLVLLFPHPEHSEATFAALVHVCSIWVEC